MNVAWEDVHVVLVNFFYSSHGNWQIVLWWWCSNWFFQFCYALQLLTATLCHKVFQWESWFTFLLNIYLHTQVWGGLEFTNSYNNYRCHTVYSWEKLTDGYSFRTRIQFFRQLCKIQCGFEHTDTMQTHFEYTHIQKSFMSLRFSTLSCTSASSACAHDGIQIRSFNLVTLVSYLQILGVVVFSI